MLDKSLIDNLKRVDPDRYRAALFADKEDRMRLLTLYAFHAELAKVPEIVSEPMIGAIRYQWWRDAVEEIYSGKPPRKHEVVTPLAKLVDECELPRFWLDQLIDGRERDLDPQPFADEAAMRDYCQNTSGILMKLAAACVGQDSSGLSELGEAWGLTGLARSWQYYHASMLSNVEFPAAIVLTQKIYDDAALKLGRVDPILMPAIAYGALIPKFTTLLASDKHDAKNQNVNYTVLSKKARLMKTIMTGRV